MGLERYVVDAVLIEKRSPTEIAKAHGISRSWLYRLINRVKAGGYQALEPKSRRPHSCPREVAQAVVAVVLELRQELAAAGHDAGPQTIAHHLATRLTQSPPARSTIWRILGRHGLITPQPHKRPRSSFVRRSGSQQQAGPHLRGWCSSPHRDRGGRTAPRSHHRPHPRLPATQRTVACP